MVARQQETYESTHNYRFSQMHDQQKQDNDDYYYEQRRSIIYFSCKKAKEYLFGKSKKTIKQEQQYKLAVKKEEERKKIIQQEQAEEIKLRTIKEAAILDQLHSQVEQAYQEHQNNLKSSENQDFLDVLHQRTVPFEKSLQEQKLKTESYKLKSSTIGFMQAHKIDHLQFQQFSGLPVQQQLRQELITNLNSFADIAQAHVHNQQLVPFIQSGALVSGMAQNYNQDHQLVDAISATNCSHGFLNCLQAMVTSGRDRCQKLATSLSFFNAEIVKYSLAVARGIATGIVSSEVTTIALSGLGALASTIAPNLTASVYAGATSLFVPIALTAGTICSGILIAELGQLSYWCGTDQFDKVSMELDRIKNFAGQFYNFDQAPVEHVENLAMLSTTLVWPWQRQLIFENLMGMQKVTCQIMIDAEHLVTKTAKVTQNQLHDALKFMQNHELAQVNIWYEKIFDEHFFNIDFKDIPTLVPAGMSGLISSADQFKLATLLMAQQSSNAGKALTVGLSQAVVPIVHNCSQEVIVAVEVMITSTDLSENAIKMFTELKPYLISDRLVDGLANIKDVRQIDDFRVITKNFTDISQLKPYEVLYLNACNYFYPQFVAINDMVKKEQLSIFIDGQIIEIDSFGLFHCELGDMKPGKLETAKRGGHLFLPELKLQTHQLENLKMFDNGYFTCNVKHFEDNEKGDLKTFFPFGTTPLECVEIIIDAIKNPKAVDILASRSPKIIGIKIINKNDQIFKIFVESKRATFYPEN